MIDLNDLYFESTAWPVKKGMHVQEWRPMPVCVTHMPTGFKIVYGGERTSHMNKDRAIELLEEKLSVSSI